MSNPQDERHAERNRRILLGAAVVATLAVIAAAVFWYSGSSTSGTAPSGKSYGRVSARVVGLVGASPRRVSTVRAAHTSAHALVLVSGGVVGVLLHGVGERRDIVVGCPRAGQPRRGGLDRLAILRERGDLVEVDRCRLPVASIAVDEPLGLQSQQRGTHGSA